MNKSARFFSFTLFSCLTFFGQTFISSAQEGEEVVMSDTRYAAVSVSEAHVLDFADKSGLSVSAKVKNIFPENRAYQVGIEFRGISEENKGELFVWRMSEEFYLEGTSDQSLSFVMSNPQHLAGKYRLTLGMNDRQGNVVAMVSLGEKEFSHAGRVSLRNCAFLGDSGVIEISKPTEPAESFGTCEVVWDGAEDGLARVVTQITSTRYGIPKVVGESKTIMKPETTALGNVVISEPMEPGFYQLEIVPVAAGGYPIGVPIKKTLVIPGKGGNLTGVTRFESGKSFAPKEVVPVVAQLGLYDTGKYDLLLELMSGGQSCATPIRASIEGQPNIYEGEFTVTANCTMPEVRATLSSDGKQIDQLANGNNDMPMQEGKDEKIMGGVPQWAFWGGAGVLAMLLLYVLTKRRNRTNRVMMPMFFLLFSVSIFLGFDTKQVEAGYASNILECVGGCGPDTYAVYNFTTDKDTYSPGETINVSLELQLGDQVRYRYASVGPYVRLGINGGSFTGDLVGPAYNTIDIENNGGLFLVIQRAAPAAAGPFNLTIDPQLSGYEMEPYLNIPLTVAVASPAPIVNLDPFSPGTITAGQSATITLSTTGATSCSGDAGSLWTGNLGGTNFSNQSTGPMSAGTYTQRVTCTGPGGSTTSATRTLTVNAASVASGNFTSGPPCVIASGQAGCSTTLGWTSSNTSTVVLTNCGGVSLSSGGTGPQSASGIYVPYNSGCYQIRNGSASGPILDQGNVTSSCTGGTSWNGSSCAAAATTASFTSGPSCVIASGQAGCNTTLSWTASNVSTIVLTNCDGDSGTIEDTILTTITSSGPGSFSPVYVPYNVGCYRIHDNNRAGPILDQIAVSSSCAPGTAYNGVLDPFNNYSPGICAPTAGAPTVDITATGPVSLESQTWWQKALSWVIGRRVTAAGNATITTSQSANISWTSSGASNCNVSGPLISSSLRNNASGQNVSGASLGVGTHTYSIQCNNANGSAQATATVTVSGSGGGSGTVCGNTIPEAGEQCDNGPSNGACPALCSSLCTSNSCGTNGVCAATHNNCSSGNSTNPTQDATTWYWDCQGFSGGSSTSCSEAKGACTPTWNPTSAPCAGVAGQFGIPPTHTNGMASLSINSCTGGTVYNGGCSAPSACQPTTNTWSGACSTFAGNYGIPASDTIGTANFSYDSCWNSTYTGGCSAPNCNNVISTFQIACSAAACEVGIPCNYTVGTATIGVTACGGTQYMGGCSLPPGAPQYTINAIANFNGTISPVGYIRNIPQGSSRTFTITPDSGYVIASVLVDGVNQGAVGSFTFNNIQSNHTIQPFFVASLAPSGQITAVTSCTIPQGGASCTGTISWTTSNASNPRLEVPGGNPGDVYGPGVNNWPFVIGYGSTTITLRDVNLGLIYDTDTITASCVGGTGWVAGSCQPAPIVNLTVNGGNGPLTVAPGDSLNVTWTVSGATNCTASGKWSGVKSATGGGPEVYTASLPSGDYVLTCINGSGVSTIDTVTVNLACTASTSSWSACGPPCAGGNGTRSRTVTTAACVVTTDTESCTTNTCRDLNWKEVGQ